MNGHDLGNAIAAQIATLVLLAALAGMVFGGGVALAIWYLS